MKTFVFFAALLLGAISLQAQDLNADITALGNAWKAAFESGDATALAATHADQVDFVNDDGSVTTRTRAEIEAGWKKSFETGSGTIEFAPDMVVTKLPDGKVSTQGSFTQTMTNQETGESVTYDAIYDHQAVQVDGQWKICRMHVTAK